MMKWILHFRGFSESRRTTRGLDLSLDGCSLRCYTAVSSRLEVCSVDGTVGGDGTWQNCLEKWPKYYSVLGLRK